MELIPTASRDMVGVVAIATLFAFAKFSLDRLIEPFVKRRLIVPLPKPPTSEKSAVNPPPSANEKVAFKFRNTSFRLFLNATICSAGLLSAYNSPWFFDPEAWFEGWPNAPLSAFNRAHYLVDAGAYLFQLGYVHFEPRQSDYRMMVVHHLVTLLLIVASFAINQCRVGEVVMLLHDICDPVLELAKLCLYLNHKIVADALFRGFALIFVVTRDVVFPGLVIRGIVLHCYKPDGTRPALTYECLACLSILLALNYIWTYMIYKSATRPDLADIREDRYREAKSSHALYGAA
ncbi:Ceramide synthase 5, partial [Massospora cicadina]